MDSTEKSQRLKAFLTQIAPDAFDSGSEGANLLHEGTVELPGVDSAIDHLASGRDLSQSGSVTLEAIIHKKFRPAVFIVDDNFGQPPDPWQHLGDGNKRENIQAAIKSIGRIELPPGAGAPFGGTGFVVASDLIMTNRHVAEIFARGLGMHVQFKMNWSAGINFKREVVPTPEVSTLELLEVVMIHPFWDMALLRVSGLGNDISPLDLSVTNTEDLIGDDIVVLGYPAQDPRNNIELQNEIFGGVYNVKRLQPGKILQRETINSFNNNVSAATHDASTLGGNSGSAVIHVETGRVLALHFAGSYLKANYAVPTFELARDSRVVDTGINFTAQVPTTNEWDNNWQRADAVAEQSGSTIGDSSGASFQSSTPTSNDANIVVNAMAGADAVTLTVPLNISLSLGDVGADHIQLLDVGSAGTTVTPANEGAALTLQRAYSRASSKSLETRQYSNDAALTCAAASALAYSDDRQHIRSVCLDSLSCRHSVFLNQGTTECFIADAEKTLLLCFRGTHGLSDWRTNLDSGLEESSHGEVHRGFLRSFLSIRPLLEQHLDQFNSPEKSIVIAGHSLGGALAVVALSEWRARYTNISAVYTFGQPAVGGVLFKNQFADLHKKVFRFVNDTDIVPRLPPGFLHVGVRKKLPPAHLIGSDLSESALAHQAEATAADEVMLSEQEFEALKSEIEADGTTESLIVPESLTSRFTDHAIAAYLDKLLMILNPA